MPTKPTTTTDLNLKGPKQTLLFTLYGKAIDYRSKSPILGDKWSADLIDRVGRLSLMVRMSAGDRFMPIIRARRMDGWTLDFLARHPDAVVVQLACGLDSRAFRLDLPDGVDWYDVDFPDVVDIRRRLFPSRDRYHLIGSSVTESAWLEEIPDDRPTLVIAEGLLMYLTEADVRDLLTRLNRRFPYGEMLFDLMGPWSARLAWLARLKMWGCDDPGLITRWNPGMKLLEDAPVMAEYDKIAEPRYRVLYNLMNRFAATRNTLRPLRFAFTREPSST